MKLSAAFCLMLVAASCTSQERIAVGNTPSVASVPNPHLIQSASSPLIDTLTFVTQPNFAADYAILHRDTLLVIASSLNVQYPFGQVKRAADIRHKYPQFSLMQGTERADGLISSYTLLHYKNSVIKYYDDKERETATVVAGHIIDPELILQNTIHNGMTLAQVLRTFFISIDQTNIQNLHVLRIDSGIAEIKCFYNFENDNLQSIDFDSYSVLSKKL